MQGANRRSGWYELAIIHRFASNPVLTHMGEVRCNMLTGALVPRWGTVAGVPGPRRSADECDAGWFAPVATRRRPFSVLPVTHGTDANHSGHLANWATRSCGTRRSRSPSLPAP